MCVPVGDPGLGGASPLGTLGWDVRPRWGRAVHRNGKNVSNGNQDVTVAAERYARRRVTIDVGVVAKKR